jgi:hypothetical protein
VNNRAQHALQIRLSPGASILWCWIFHGQQDLSPQRPLDTT